MQTMRVKCSKKQKKPLPSGEKNSNSSNLRMHITEYKINTGSIFSFEQRELYSENKNHNFSIRK